MAIPRCEYPRPQFVRREWLCLNGEWEFEIDRSDSGLERGLGQRALCGRIVVPFCPEAELSGIGDVDFMHAVWYRRRVELPASWSGRRVLLHFQAVDYEATVWVNGREVGRHRGGFSPFSCDLGGIVSGGECAEIVVRARDLKDEPQPAGKQSPRYENYGCRYTRTTGIWQTVWLEPVPETRLGRPRITPDLGGSRFLVTVPLNRNLPGTRLRLSLHDAAGQVAVTEVAADRDLSVHAELGIPASRRRLWGPGSPHLYDVNLELLGADGALLDTARSYAGLRSVAIDGQVLRINGQAVFQRLVLDQGYYPDGIMTAPSDEALRRDIELALAAGFNGARLHQKVFEERFLYHADRLGYLVWGEFGDWGGSGHTPIGSVRDAFRHQAAASMITQWLEVLERDYSHPCIVGWCPLNETNQEITDSLTTLDDVTRGMYLACKAMDCTRPVLDASGYAHRVPGADIYDCHDYEQDPAVFQENHAGVVDKAPFSNNPKWSVPYRGQPFFVSEFGGIWWNPEAGPGDASWGYGQRPADLEEYYARFAGLCRVLLRNRSMFGYCYTQLTDVFQEQNGIFTFARREKFDLERLRAVQAEPAASELAEGRNG